MKRIVFVLFLMLPSVACACAVVESSFCNLIAEMDKFYEHMEQMFTHNACGVAERAGASQKMIGLSIEQTDHTVDVSCLNIETKQVDAHWDEDKNQLEVQSDGVTVLLTYENNLLYVVIVQEQKEEQKDDAGNIIGSFFSQYSNNQAVSVVDQIDLLNVEIAYDAEQKKLSIAIPKIVKVKKKIAVTMK